MFTLEYRKKIYSTIVFQIKKMYFNFIYRVTQLFDTANFMYILPAHRITVYIMGILLGYILRTYKDLKLTKVRFKIN